MTASTKTAGTKKVVSKLAKVDSAKPGSKTPVAKKV
jgi:hypothetical protein